jgi:hypothetical protein
MLLSASLIKSSTAFTFSSILFAVSFMQLLIPCQSISCLPAFSFLKSWSSSLILSDALARSTSRTAVLTFSIYVLMLSQSTLLMPLIKSSRAASTFSQSMTDVTSRSLTFSWISSHWTSESCDLMSLSVLTSEKSICESYSSIVVPSFSFASTNSSKAGTTCSLKTVCVCAIVS